ncbi:uncharacterized protein LOC126906572 isoform X2 [Daktulosphaira vitifoliae]|nr:uncharacterized protein LOC126906572 isoform X2 [Daktulosphaira vitifoliae]XP_050543116.1 uncharacterized protein LOC126906572 isoform X2 [Daktulosphaira vitifoliae]
MLDNGRCVGGEMQILELGRPYVGGSWCGFSPLDGNPPAVYYSESGTVTMTLRIPYSGLFQSIPFRFDLRFKFLDNQQASVRLGTTDEPKERGEPVPGTYCSRNFYECYRKKCSLQSPNYPGMYPRNVSCHFTVRQKVVPKCKHAMVSLSQKHGVRLLQTARASNETAIVRVNDMCKNDADKLVFHDGPTEDDPVLLTYCGGPVLPRIVSSGPVMLIVFRSATFDTPGTFSSPVPVSVLRSFELDLQIAFVDSDSLDYSRGKHFCEFVINASSSLKSRRGILVNPQHSIPPNSTCTYRFQGKPDDKIWLFFESYGHRSTNHYITFKPCPTRLRLWDGAGTLMGDHCDAPKLCEHASLPNKTRPCSMPDESYLSKSASVFLQVHTVLGTVLEPYNFKLHYEFVDSSVYDRDDTDGGGCVINYKVRKSIDIAEPRNVFLYGRGGAKNFDCLYRLHAEPGYRMQIVMRNASFGSRECGVQQMKTIRSKLLCPEGDGSKLTISEVYWQGLRLERGCYCQNFTENVLGASQVTYDPSSSLVEIRFRVSNLAVTEDFTNIYFNVHIRVTRSPACPRKQWVRGSGGEIELVYPPQLRDDIYCHDKPWLLEARTGHSMFVQTWGHFLPLNTSLSQCKTRNRVMLYELEPVRLIKQICPADVRDDRRSIHMFSDEWADYLPVAGRQSPRFMVEFLALEPGSLAFKWLEVSKPEFVAAQPNRSVNFKLGCVHGCPELNACISSTLWCDGHKNCPSGVDESDLNCQTKWPTVQAALQTYGVPVVAVTLFGLVFALLAFIYCSREPDYKTYEEPEQQTTITDHTRSCSTIAS